MTVRILVMGLPGAGKTTLALALKNRLESRGKSVSWFNADQVRQQNNDWDFSFQGRLRQSLRMKALAESSLTDYAICDFVAPLPLMRFNFEAHWTIWMDTIAEGRFEDTNKAFTAPDYYDFRITEQNAEHWAEHVAHKIVGSIRNPLFDWRKETVQMLGRWQPWHAGHRALFERLLQRTGQVCIMVRDCQGWNDSNPFNFADVEYNIKRDLEPLYQGKFQIIKVPNITHIGYGRGVGYTIAEEQFGEDITSISATQIRKDMGLK